MEQDMIAGAKFEVGFYEFIRSELSGLETRIDKRFAEQELRTDKRFAEMELRTNERFSKMDDSLKELKDEVRWPRRIATAGTITTVIAMVAAIIGFKK
jgi:preprotein translocase subunit SecE